jgi:hypothetical protein
MLLEIREQGITGEASVKETDTVGREEGQQLLRLLPFIALLEGTHGAPDGQTAEDLIHGRHQALRRMATAGTLEATRRIEGLPDGFRCGENVLGPIKGKDREPVPRIFLPRWKHFIGSGDGLPQKCVKGLPRYFGPGFAQGAAVRALGVRPEGTASGQGEEIAQFGIDAFIASTCDQGQEEHKKAQQRKLPMAGKILSTVFGELWDKTVQQLD